MALLSPELEGVSYTTLHDLLQQKAKTALLLFGQRELHASQAGSHLSIHKGRGMDYAESRPYQHGDDVRHLDWRVTARTGKPHTKLFSEERERPIFILLDLGKSMHFGTRKCFKSVMACRVGSLLVWKALQEGDKAGGLIMGGNTQAIFKPQRSKEYAASFIKSMAISSQNKRDEKQAGMEQCIDLVSKVVTTGTELVIISDFHGLTAIVNHQLQSLVGKVSLKLVEVVDPLEQEITEGKTSFAISDGKQTMQVNEQMRKAYRQGQQERQLLITDLETRFSTKRIHLSTADPENLILLNLGRGMH